MWWSLTVTHSSLPTSRGSTEGDASMTAGLRRQQDLGQPRVQNMPPWSLGSTLSLRGCRDPSRTHSDVDE